MDHPNEVEHPTRIRMGQGGFGLKQIDLAWPDRNRVIQAGCARMAFQVAQTSQLPVCATPRAESTSITLAMTPGASTSCRSVGFDEVGFDEVGFDSVIDGVADAAAGLP